ncbi:MAG: transcriptional regulator, TetR family [Holophagaceae bacterium]|nr:transcriptional regulator, TetR family [Holophagaceae bacterium]
MREAKKAKVLEAAQAVFLRYGFRRVTMGDIATAAGISRPALYLHFCNKENLFQEVLRTFAGQSLSDLREGLSAHTSPEAQLRFAFEIWAVRPFGLLTATPDAKELIDCGFEFAREAIDQGSRAFEAEVAAILAPLCAEAVNQPPPDEIARILTRAVHGFKQTAASVEELRAMIGGLLSMVLASLAPGPKP